MTLALPDLLVHFGEQPHTTAHHIVRALRQHTSKLTCVGRGHERRHAPGRAPLLWIESGRPSLPTAAELEGRRSAAWLIDTHRGLSWRGALAQAFDTVFVAQRAAIAPLAELGVVARWLPLAFPSDLAPAESAPSIDVDFVGNVVAGSRRERIIAPIAERYGIRLGEYVEPAAMIERYARARIVVNVPLANDLNMRVFEAAGAGAHVLTGPMDGLDEVLGPTCCTVVATDRPEEWLHALDELLSNREALDRTRAMRREVIAGAHTYDRRARLVLDALEAPPQNRPTASLRQAGVAGAAGHLGLVRVVTSSSPLRNSFPDLARGTWVATRRGLGAVRRRSRP